MRRENGGATGMPLAPARPSAYRVCFPAAGSPLLVERAASPQEIVDGPASR